MTVPVLVSTNPVNLSSDVPITQTITFTFNTAIDPTSVKKGTFFLYIESTGDAVEANLQVSGESIYLKPVRALFEDVTYVAACMGKSSGTSAGNIKSLDGDDLPSNIVISFTSEVKKFATLEEVSSRADAQGYGYLNEADIEEPGGLSLVDVDPSGFSTDLPTSLDEVVFEFSSNIDESTLTGNFTMATENVLGDEMLYGAVASSNGLVYLQQWSPGTGECDFSQPVGTFTVEDNKVTWTRGAGEPEFNYNTQIIFNISKKLKDTNGQSLLTNTVVALTTEFFPKYQTVQIIRTMCGPMVSDQYDDAINRMIHRVSLDAFDIAAYKFDPHNPYPAVKRYVRYATILDIGNLLTSRASIYAGQKKTLGDLSIEYADSLPRIDSGILAKAALELQALENELRHYRGQGKPGFVVKGVASPDRRVDTRSRRWDIEYGGSLFTDMTNILVPATNLRALREGKLGFAGDATRYYLSRTAYFTEVGGNVGLFVAPTPS